MKIKSLIAGLLLSSVAANASVTLSGTSLYTAGLNGFTTGVYVASDSSTFNPGLFSGIGAVLQDTSFAFGTSINGYTVLGTGVINAAGGASALGAGVTYNLSGAVSTGNEIGILAFQTSTTEALAGDNYLVFYDNWTVPADGSNLSLTGTGGPSFASYGQTGTVSGAAIPEPSTYATLAGLLALSFVMLRRRG